VTVHLISVGKSVIDALDKPRGKLGNSALEQQIANAKLAHLMAPEVIHEHQGENASAWLASALAAPGSQGYDQAKADRLAEAVTKAELMRWTDKFSAELETLAHMPDTGRPFPEEHIAVLVCSDTPIGLLAGLWTALALTGGTLSRVLYLADPAASGKRLSEARGHVVIVRVPGMDAGNERGFAEAMGALGALARDLFRYGQLKHAERFQFCLSGGFKAAIPYLIGMAEAVRSIDEWRLKELHADGVMPGDGPPYPVEAYVLHESAPEGTDPIRLPLRHLIASAVRKELAGFGDESTQWVRRDRGVPGAGVLEGYAYTVKGSSRRETCKLTAFGVGLRALLGIPAEPW
jgi:hypothetical protein